MDSTPLENLSFNFQEKISITKWTDFIFLLVTYNLFLLSRFSYILENKQTNKISSTKKVETWQEVEEMYNCQSQSGPRTWKQLRILYHNLKRVTRKDVASDNVVSLKSFFIHNK